MNQHPRELDFGNLSLIFKKICDEIESCGFLIRCEMNSDGSVKSWQTIQFYLKDEDYTHINGKSNNLLIHRAIGAVQYEGSNDYSKSAPHTVNWRFYRHNLPKQWKSILEQIDNEFRKDKNKGPRANLEAQSIAFKFTTNDEHTNRFIDELISHMAKLLRN